jgi:hypothetical protein
MTVIFSNNLDDDCLILSNLWRNIDNINIIEIHSDSINWEYEVDKAIEKEKNILIIAGHGTTQGLLFPDFSKGEYIIHENNVNLINAKLITCCWCYASSFVQKYNLSAFSTSMFISNESEALDNFIYDCDQLYINNTGKQFYLELKELLLNNIPISEWTMILGGRADINNPIDMFNRQGLYYNDLSCSTISN